jgi:hypothetical protein
VVDATRSLAPAEQYNESVVCPYVTRRPFQLRSNIIARRCQCLLCIRPSSVLLTDDGFSLFTNTFLRSICVNHQEDHLAPLEACVCPTTKTLFNFGQSQRQCKSK